VSLMNVQDAWIGPMTRDSVKFCDHQGWPGDPRFFLHNVERIISGSPHRVSIDEGNETSRAFVRESAATKAEPSHSKQPLQRVGSITVDSSL